MTVERADGRWLVHADSATVAAAVRAVPPDGGAVRWVVSDPSPADDEAAEACGLSARRDVLQLRRGLPVRDGRRGAAEVAVRAFRPGTGDEAAWIACNNRAFARHPDQSGFTPDRLHALMAQPWFDPAGFLLHEEQGRLTGFCWTKVHAEPPLGEIFVIGIDPDVGGRGLGGALTLAGLDVLAARGLGTAMLYVDAGNTGARRMYGHLGFTLHHVDRVYETAGGAGGATGPGSDADADDAAHGEGDAGGDGGDAELAGG